MADYPVERVPDQVIHQHVHIHQPPNQPPLQFDAKGRLKTVDRWTDRDNDKWIGIAVCLCIPGLNVIAAIYLICWGLAHHTIGTLVLLASLTIAWFLIT